MRELASTLHLEPDRDRETERDRRLDRGWRTRDDRDEACEDTLASDREQEPLVAPPR